MNSQPYRGYQRCSRIDYSDGNSAFVITLCVKPRRNVFINAERNQRLLAETRRLQAEGMWAVHVYCIMPDHVHLVVSPSRRGLPEAVKRLKGRVAAWWRSHGDGYPLWQGGYFDHRIRTSEGFRDKCLYVLQNPVRAGLVQKTDDYRWAGCFPP